MAGCATLNRMKTMKHTTLTITILLGLLLTAQAQTPSATPDRQRAETGLPFVTWFSPQEYRSTPQTWSFAQDDRGLLYVGATSGILEYDGVSWRPIATPHNDIVRAMAKGADGRIFVGEVGDFGYLQPDANGEMKFVSLLEYVPQEEREFQDIRFIHVAPEGVYFHAREKLFRLTPDATGWRVKVWKPKTAFGSLFYVFGSVYLSAPGLGLQRLNGETLETLPWPGLGDQTGDSAILVMTPYAEAGAGNPRQILIGNRVGQLSLLDDKGVRPFPTDAASILQSQHIVSAIILRDGAIGICLRTGGFVILEHNGKLRRYLDRAAGIQSEGVLNAFTDRNGTVWLGLQTGIAKVETASPLTEFGRSVGMSGMVQAMVRYRGDLYIAALTGNLRRLDTATSTFQPVPGFAYAQAFGALLYGDQLLVAVGTDGVVQVTGNTVQPVRLDKTTDTGVFALAVSRQNANRVWLCTQDGLAAMRRDATGRWVDEGLVAKTPALRSIVEPEPGVLWMGAEAQGVVRVRLQGDSLQNPKVERFGKAEGLSSAGGGSVFLAAGRILFVANEGGVREFDEATGRFIESKWFGAVPTGNAGEQGLVTDAQGNIWACFGARPVLLRRQGDGSYKIEETFLRRIGESLVARMHADDDGVLWLGGADRLFRYDPAQASSGNNSFPALVRRVTAGEQSQTLLYGGSEAAAQPERSLAYRDNALRFEYAAASLEDPTRNQYQTMLVGFDHDWSAWTHETRRDYTNLPPGSYRFRVKALNALGQAGTEAEYRLTILPPWYRTWWAYGAYALLLGLAAYGSRHWAVGHEREKSRRNREELEATVAARTQEIAARNQEISARAAELATVNNITQALTSQLDKDALIQLVGEQVREVFNASIAFVALLNRKTMMIEFPYLRGEDLEPIPYGEGMTSQIIQTGKPLLINRNFDSNRQELGVRLIGRQPASFLGVPIRAGGEVVGVISVQSMEEEGRFTEADQRLLSTIATGVGVTFYNAQLYETARSARVAAEEADAAKSTFLSTVSHELRTPLTSVLGFAKIIRRRLEERLFPLLPDDDKKVAQTKQQVSDNLNVVISEGERLTKLINDVLDLAKIEAGKFTWNLETVSLSEIIKQAVLATASLHEAKKLQVVRDIADGLPTITADRDRLMQVVINLISNAVKFTHAGTITCTARRVGDELIVSVADSGVGIKPEDQPRVFEKFKQVGDTLTDKPQGTGLGLPICKEIVEYHGGRIWVESALGQGSTFSFSLPITKTDEPLRTRATAAPALQLEALIKQLRENVTSQEPPPRSILVVDDDPNIRAVLQQEFTEAGYLVRLAENGRQALSLIRDEIPGLVVLDVMMPEMNGFDVAAVLKNDPTTMNIPIIILSIVEDKERGFRLGVDRYLTKPIDTTALFREVDTLLEQGKSKKKVMVVDEDVSTLRSLSEVLETRGYHVTESNGAELLAKAVAAQPDIIVLSSLLSGSDSVRSLRFEKGMENVLFLIYQQERDEK